MHEVSIMLAGKDVTGSSHVGSQLIYFIEAAVDYVSNDVLVTQVTDDKIIGYGFCKPGIPQIYTAYPKSILFKPPD
jgi:hypothetical protein